MKKKILIIISYFIVILVYILIFAFTKDKYIGIWSNSVVYDNLTISSTIKINSNGNVFFEKLQSDALEKYIRNGNYGKMNLMKTKKLY